MDDALNDGFLRKLKETADKDLSAGVTLLMIHRQMTEALLFVDPNEQAAATCPGKGVCDLMELVLREVARLATKHADLYQARGLELSGQKGVA